MKDSDYVKINSLNPMYLIISEVDSCIKERNGNKYLTLVSADKNKEVLIKYTKIRDKIRNMIECNSIECNSIKAGEYKKDFIKIKFNSDDNLPLNKILKLHNMTIAIRSVFQEDGKYYPEVVLDECLYEL